MSWKILSPFSQKMFIYRVALMDHECSTDSCNRTLHHYHSYNIISFFLFWKEWKL